MVEQSEQRRLAAILAADMVGYSRLMEADERGTVARQKTHRTELIDPKIDEHHGRIVKTTGDGILIEFASVVDAVEFAIAIQRAMVDREYDVSEDKRIQYRIGINVGDVIDEEGDLLGAGVNVAARLEGLAEPGGICISRTARDQVRDLLDIALEDMGEVEVKNIERPVRVFRVLLEGEHPSSSRRPAFRKRILPLVAALVIVVAASVGVLWWQPWVERVEPARAEQMAYPLPDKPSIVVLPFDNMSDDSAQEYFADGLTETIISQLSKTPQLFVIARNSAFTYKNKPVKVQQVSEELGVRYVLEGSVQRTGDQIRVQAQLIDATTGEHIWSGKYDRKAENILAIQDDIALNIAVTIEPNEGRLAVAERSRIQAKGSKNLKAWDHIQRSLSHWWKFKKGSNLQCREEALKAIELDPNFARPHAFIGWTYLAEVWFGWTENPKESVAQAEAWARKAISLDEKEYHGHHVMAYVYMLRHQFDEAGISYEKALELNPNGATTLMNYGFAYLASVGRAEEGVDIVKKAMRLNPRHPERWHGNLAIALYVLGQYEQAISSIKRVTKPRIDHLAILAGSYAQLGQSDRAREVVEKILRDRSDYSVEKISDRKKFKYNEDAQRWREGFRKAGLPEHSPPKLPDKPSIAVLPFDNLSGDPAQEYLGDGITENIISSLSKVSEMLVIARNSTYTYKGKPTKVQQIARELGVRYVLDGSVQRSDEKLRVTAKLIDAVEGHNLWSETYDRQLDDLFAVQDDITREIVVAMQVQITDGEQAKIRHRSTNNLKAWALAVQGHTLFENYKKIENAKAREFFKQAIELDQNYAYAWAWLGFTHYIDASFRFTKDRAASMKQLAEAAEKALEIDNQQTGAHAVLGGLQYLQGNYDEAVAAGRHAIALAPNNAENHAILAIYTLAAGDWDETIALSKRAIRLHPHHPRWYWARLSTAYAFTGQYDLAIKAAREGMRRAKSENKKAGYRIRVAFAQMESGREEAARREISMAVKAKRKRTISFLRKWYNFKNPAHMERMATALRKAGLPE